MTSNRYSRQQLLPEIGIQGQEKLKDASVLVIGAGGLGCPVLQILGTAGVGKIGIIDNDLVEESNLHRQTLFGMSALGENKAKAAKKRLVDLNPEIEVQAYDFRLVPSNALRLFEEYDMIVDGSDNFATRYLVNDASIITKKPMVYGSVYRFEGQVSVFNFKNGPSYRCLFPDPPNQQSVPNCNEIGVLGTVTGLVGQYMANETLKMILGFGTVLSGQLMIVNALKNQHQTIEIGVSYDQIRKVLKAQDQFETTDYEALCGTQTPENIDEISSETLRKALETGAEYAFVDIRDYGSLPKDLRLKGQHIPFAELDAQTPQIDRNKKVIVYCQSGVTSVLAIQKLQESFGFENLINLKGGMISWIQEMSEKEALKL